MSIEKALADLTAAVQSNTEALKASASSPAKTTKKAATVEAPQSNPAAALAPVPAASAPAAAPAVATAPAAGVPFKAVADALVALVSKKGRDAGVALLGKFGAKNAAGLKVEQYGEFVTAAITAAEPEAVAAVPGSDLI